MNHWTVDQTMILTRDEISQVMQDQRRPERRRYKSNRGNLILFRLSTFSGLRVSEIVGLKLSNLKLGIDRPYIQIPAAIAKGHESRRVPLWWDAANLQALEAWKASRMAEGASTGSLVVTTFTDGPISRQVARRRFIHCCKVLGANRQATLTIHHGRHSFVSHCLAGGLDVTKVRDAVGHRSISTTNIYSHVVTDSAGEPTDLFSF